MIKSFAHKGLQQFFLTGSIAGIQAKHPARLSIILQLLHKAKEPAHVDFPGAHLHPLKGKMKGLWAIKVSGNWRVTFYFRDGNAEIVDYQDYH